MTKTGSIRHLAVLQTLSTTHEHQTSARCALRPLLPKPKERPGCISHRHHPTTTRKRWCAKWKFSLTWFLLLSPSLSSPLLSSQLPTEILVVVSKYTADCSAPLNIIPVPWLQHRVIQFFLYNSLTCLFSWWCFPAQSISKFNEHIFFFCAKVINLNIKQKSISSLEEIYKWCASGLILFLSVPLVCILLAASFCPTLQFYITHSTD